MRPEDRLRARCAMLLKSHLMSPCWFTAIEHGRRHHGTMEQRAREWQHLARQGVQRGVADLLVLAPGYCAFVELKTQTGRQSDAQHAFQAAMAALGHGYAVCRSVEQLGEELSQRGIPLAAGWRQIAQAHDAALDVEPKPKRPAKPRAAKPSRGQVARWNATLLERISGR